MLMTYQLGCIEDAHRLVDAVQRGVDQLGTNLANVDLKLSVHKFRFVCFRAPGTHRMCVVIQINS